MTSPPNNLPESNRHCTSPLSAAEKFGGAVHAKRFIFGGGRSANR
jgi:hypothetical protein